MGPRHSKRSLDMAGTPTKGEIEGVGNVGKLEKIVDGFVEKVSANGHVDGEIQNGTEPIQNGLEPVQNGEAAAVSLDPSLEKIKLEEKEEVATMEVNGEIDDKLTAESDEKVGDAESKDDKKKKEKKEKEKVVKKKFSFRSFSFSKKDKSKPKDEKVPDTKSKTEVEESQESPTPEEKIELKDEQSVEEIKEEVPVAVIPETAPEPHETEKFEREKNIISPAPIVVMAVDATVMPISQQIEVPEMKSVEKEKSEEELPPPLPASPPPSEVKEEIKTEVVEDKETEDSVSVEIPEPKTPDTAEVKSDVLIATEHIEEKASDLLKAVEEKVVESQRNESEPAIEDSPKPVPAEEIPEAPSATTETPITLPESTVKEEEEVPKTISSLGTLSTNVEETVEKPEESGAGESLAEMDVGIPEITPNAHEEVAVAE